VAKTLSAFHIYLAASPDMGAERSYLHQHVIPELNRHWEPLGVPVGVVDLRTTRGLEDSAAGVEVALPEIEQHRWFLALLSERYGRLLTTFPPRVLNHFPWLREVEATSLLELEIVYGVLLREWPQPLPPGLFYLRDPAFLSEAPAEQRRQYVEEEPVAAARMAELKQVLRASPRAVVRDYRCRWNAATAGISDLTAFGKQVFADLSRAIEIQRDKLESMHTDAPRTIGSDQFPPPLAPAPAGKPQAPPPPPAPTAPSRAASPVAAPPASSPPAGPRFGEVFQKLPAAPSEREAPRKPARTDADTLTVKSPAISPQPLYVDENVQFTVYRPRVVQPRKWYPLLAFAHLAERRPDAPADEPDPVAEVYRQAKEVLGKQAKDYHDVTQDSRAAVPREGEITFVPEVPGVEFNPPRRTFLWQEQVHREEFRLRAAAELDGKTVRGRMTVFLGTLILADVALSIKVDSSARPASEEPAEPASARPYRRIFASYSHRDLHVVQQVEHFTRAMGDEYLRDWTHLRAGEVWNDRLMQLIEQADVFQLFWSNNSMQSPYVRQEWEHALSLGRPNFIRPVYWEEPLPASPDGSLPPEELRRIHFQKLYVEALSHPAMRQAEAAPTASVTAAEEPVLAYLTRGDAWEADREDSGITRAAAPAAPPPPPAPAAAAPPAAAPPPPADAPDWRSAPPPARRAAASAPEEQARRRTAETWSAPPVQPSVPPPSAPVTPSPRRRYEDEEEAQARIPALSKYRTRRFPWFLAALVLFGLAGLAFLVWRFFF
jgi:hypothetical protein